MSEPKPKKMVSRNVAVALGIICIILIAFVAYFAVTDISAQKSISNLQSQVKDLTDTVNLAKSSVWLENKTINVLPIFSQIVITQQVQNAGFILTRTSSTINNTYLLVEYSAAVPVASGTFYQYSTESYHYSNRVEITVESNDTDNIFPVLPSTTVYIILGNSNTAERADIAISIAFYY
jgi:predicted PurR-regulated permease PerM